MSEYSQNKSGKDKHVITTSTEPSQNEIPEKSEIEAYTQTSSNDIKQYIEAAAEATERSRRVLIILITASVLALVTTWNSREGSWFNERYRLISAALVLVDEHNQRRPPQDPAIIKLRQEDNGLYERAEEYLNYRKIIDREILTKRLEGLDEQRLSQVSTVRMPFFGVGFDVNDIGIFAGFTFAVVLLWFRFSLLREVNNLRLTFHEAGNQDRAKAKDKNKDEDEDKDEDNAHEQLRFCYDMLAMRQVLNTPNMSPQENPATLIRHLRQVFWVLVSKSLFLLPLMVQLLVIRNDSRSIKVGHMISPRNTELVTQMSWAFLFVIAVLTTLCYLLVFKSNETWKKAARELNLK
ncbi:MAG: hypothetical protein WCD76_08915 [Pyrinomonadaceae bacterium]